MGALKRKLHPRDHDRAEQLARKFHETYERLAPLYSYTTRRRSAVPWERVPGDNKRLMIATAAEILAYLDLLDD